MGTQETRAATDDLDVHRTQAFLRRAASGGAALMVCAESEADRTRRRDAIVAAAQATGVMVLIAQGGPAVVESRFSVLAQLLAPLRSDFDRLRPDHRQALACLLDQRPLIDTETVVLAAAELLGLASAQRRILVVVDNVEWLDAGTAEVLSAVGRRLSELRLGLVACFAGGLEEGREPSIPKSLNGPPWVSAPGWGARAARKPKRRGDKFGLDSLTRQQREVALLAASGLTNRAIGEHLFISHRTISAHLRQVFPKLGVTTRAGLRDALSDDPTETEATGISANCPASIKPRELEIAMLAATGLTNKEIADRLYLSYRTVGANLYRIFPKLGITTRAALRDALASLTADSQHPGEETL